MKSARDDRLNLASVTSKTLSEQMYREIKRNIISGAFPAESKLRIEDLSQKFGVSSGTIREALLMLVADMLVVAEGQRGFRIAPVSLSDFREITDLRKILESNALRESIRLGDDNWESQIVAAFHKLALMEARLARKSEAGMAEWSRLNEEFHEALLGGAPSLYGRNFRRILHHGFERYRSLSLEYPRRPNVSREHKAIMDATLARKAKEACALLEDHIEKAFVIFAKRSSIKDEA